MGNPKDQHYNSRFVLRHFSKDGEHIWTYSNAEGVDCRKIEKTFVSRHLYTRKSVDTNNKASQSPDPRTFEQSIRKDYDYERRIGQLESNAAPIIKRIIDQARKQKCPQLSVDQCAVWKEFAFLTARRTPEAQARVRATYGTDAPDLFYNVAKTVADRDGVSLPDKEHLYEDPRVAVMEDLVMSNSNASFAVGLSPRIPEQIQKFCEETGIQVLLCTGKRRLIIGSFGFATVTRSNDAKYNTISVFPIAPDVAVVPTDRPDREELCMIDDSHVRAINVSIADQSHTIAGSTEADVRNYMKYVKTIV